MSKKLIEIVREKYPTAITATLVKKCDNCKNAHAIFFQLDGDGYLGLGWFSGGVYCPHCGFGNAAHVHVDNMVSLGDI